MELTKKGVGAAPVKSHLWATAEPGPCSWGGRCRMPQRAGELALGLAISPAGRSPFKLPGQCGQIQRMGGGCLEHRAAQ